MPPSSSSSSSFPPSGPWQQQQIHKKARLSPHHYQSPFTGEECCCCCCFSENFGQRWRRQRRRRRRIPKAEANKSLNNTLPTFPSPVCLPKSHYGNRIGLPVPAWLLSFVASAAVVSVCAVITDPQDNLWREVAAAATMPSKLNSAIDCNSELLKSPSSVRGSERGNQAIVQMQYNTPPPPPAPNYRTESESPANTTTSEEWKVQKKSHQVGERLNLIYRLFFTSPKR